MYSYSFWMERLMNCNNGGGKKWECQEEEKNSFIIEKLFDLKKLVHFCDKHEKWAAINWKSKLNCIVNERKKGKLFFLWHFADWKKNCWSMVIEI